MEHLIYVFIQEDNIKCYPNLRQLTNDNPIVPYFSIVKLLKTTSIIRRTAYTIAVTKLKYRTNRTFKRDNALNNDY
jgi:hypothetical protein